MIELGEPHIQTQTEIWNKWFIKRDNHKHKQRETMTV